MRSKYAVTNGILSLLIFLINGIMIFITRKVMLPILGSELVGLTATFSDILVFLNLADMGLSGSIGASLYEPVNSMSFSRIKGILLWFKKLYRYCGFIFMGGTLLATVVIKFSFHNNQISSNAAALYFFLTSASVGVSYFFSYRLIILSVDQRMFRLKIINSLVMMISAAIKIFVLYYYRSFTLFLISGIIFTLLYFLIINLLIKAAYSKVENTVAELEEKDKNKITRNVKGMLFHQVGYFAVCGTNNLYTAIFAGLTEAAVLSNYMMIITVLSGVISSVFNGFISSIGNLISAENPTKRYTVFRMLFFITCCFTTTAAVSFVNCAQPFVGAWFGHSYMAGNIIVYMLAFYFFINTIRLPSDQFKNAAGIFYEDRYVPLAESLLNAAACLLLGYKFGMVGVVSGNILSTVFIIAWQKPYMAFKYVFKTGLINYFKDLSQYLGICVACILITAKLCAFTDPFGLMKRFLINALISISVCFSLFTLAFFKTHRFRLLRFYIMQVNLHKKRESEKTEELISEEKIAQFL
jgi:O-antigen/teichoic acid export membrane protein